MRMVIGIDPDNLSASIDYWDLFNEEVLDYCDSIGISFQSWSGDLSGAEIGMCNDGIAVDLSSYQTKGLGYLLCGQNDWDTDEYNFKFVPEGNSKNINSKIETYFSDEKIE